MQFSTSNTRVFNALRRLLLATEIPSATIAGTKTLVYTGVANSSIIYDLCFRNFDGTNARNFNIWIGINNTSFGNNRCQIVVPANAGNNGVVPLASLISLTPALFQNAISGDRYFILENTTISIWVENIVTLTSNINVTTHVGEF